MTERELRQAIRADLARRELKDGQHLHYQEIADKFPHSGLEQDLFLCIVKDEMARNHVLR